MIDVKANFKWNEAAAREEIGRRIQANMLDLGRRVVTIARNYAPVRSGRLRESIEFDYNAADFTLVFVVGASYGMFVEFGTRYMVPHPYLRPALNTVGPIFGFNTEMAFANVPHIRDPIRARGAGFRLPKSLTAKQREHVQKHLIPTSKRHHIGNVKRAKLVKRRYK